MIKEKLIKQAIKEFSTCGNLTTETYDKILSNGTPEMISALSDANTFLETYNELLDTENKLINANVSDFIIKTEDKETVINTVQTQILETNDSGTYLLIKFVGENELIDEISNSIYSRLIIPEITMRNTYTDMATDKFIEQKDIHLGYMVLLKDITVRNSGHYTANSNGSRIVVFHSGLCKARDTNRDNIIKELLEMERYEQEKEIRDAERNIIQVDIKDIKEEIIKSIDENFKR